MCFTRNKLISNTQSENFHVVFSNIVYSFRHMCENVIRKQVECCLGGAEVQLRCSEVRRKWQLSVELRSHISIPSIRRQCIKLLSMRQYWTGFVYHRICSVALILDNVTLLQWDSFEDCLFLNCYFYYMQNHLQTRSANILEVSIE